MEFIYEAIESCTLLQALPSNLVESYYKDGRFVLKRYNKGEILHFEDDYCDALEILVHGKIDVDRINEAGNLLTVTSFGKGNTIGANLLFSSNPYFPMTVTAKEATQTLFIHKDLAFELCNIYPKFLKQFFTVISDHTIILGTKIKHHVSRTIRQGLIIFISRESTRQKSDTITLPLSKKDLADRMGINRSSLSRELQSMKKDGLIDFNVKSITILNHASFNYENI